MTFTAVKIPLTSWSLLETLILNACHVDIFPFVEAVVDVIAKTSKIALIIFVNLTIAFTHTPLISLDILRLLLVALL